MIYEFLGYIISFIFCIFIVRLKYKNIISNINHTKKCTKKNIIILIKIYLFFTWWNLTILKVENEKLRFYNVNEINKIYINWIIYNYLISIKLLAKL